MASSKRLIKELGDLAKEPLDGIIVESQDDNVYKWNAQVQGPANTPYAGGTYKVTLEFPIEYPFKGPKVRFLTPIYHPNIDGDGNFCVGVLKAEAWKPSTKASTILLAIRNMIAEPAPDDALVASIAEVYLNDRERFNKIAMEHAKKHATST